jgi:ankyrin repeat protein
MPENKDDIDLKGWTLHRAAEESRVDITRALIARGDVNASNYGNTPLHEAARHDSTDVVRLLIEKGANTDRIDLNWMDDQEDA